MKGPAIFLAQFAEDIEPYNNLPNICRWVSSLGYKGIQIPSWDTRFIDLQKAAESKTYAEEISGTAKEFGLDISELSTHLQGQLVAVHPAYNVQFDDFADEEVKNNPKARQEWAVQQMKWAAKASHNLGLNACASFSGALLWHTVYPWPQRPPGLVDKAFKELASRWKPILDEFDNYGVDVCYELHPGEDLHDGITFERFLEAVGQHKRCKILYDPSHFVLQCLNYLDFIDYYHTFIKMFHVKDAEFNPTGKSGVYGGYQAWMERPGRFRSLGDGQVDFKSIFSKLTQYGFEGWAVLEWECAIKDGAVGAAEGAPFIQNHMIPTTSKSFDDFAGGNISEEKLDRILML